MESVLYDVASNSVYMELVVAVPFADAFVVSETVVDVAVLLADAVPASFVHAVAVFGTMTVCRRISQKLEGAFCADTGYCVQEAFSGLEAGFLHSFRRNYGIMYAGEPFPSLLRFASYRCAFR